ncbi:MAG: alpha-2-macroglobulin [Nitrospinaceae bacterium]|nr:MAG: alpha-2-macroglobulin [Nitrospinaceae bacterium]
MRGFQAPWRLVLWIGIAIGFLAVPLSAGEKDPAALQANAEAYYAKKSYARANALYREIAALKPEGDLARWVDFRIADTQWRAAAATDNPDPTLIEEAQRALEVQVRDIRRAEEEDRIYSEVHESLADFWWTRPQSKNWSQAWVHYQKALDGWAGASDIDLARKRYLAMVWKMTRPPWKAPHEYYGYYGNFLPLEVIENAVEIATDENDRMRAQYLLALSLKRQGGQNPRRVGKAFEAAILEGQKSEWYDDALFQYAEWLSSYGGVIILENGQQRRQPDYPKALEVYRSLLKEFKKGETRYFDQAKHRIETITKPTLGVSVANIFLPESEIQVHLNFRNLDHVDWSLYAVDLTEDVRLGGKDGLNRWMRGIATARQKKIASGREPTGDKGLHQLGHKSTRIADTLPRGAYLLEATGGGERARELVLVTESTLVLKTSGKQALTFFADALDGSPIANARVTLWERYYDGRKWIWQDHKAKSGDDGLVVFDLAGVRKQKEIFAAARRDGSQAFATGQAYRQPAATASWRLYVSTDRPAYRPRETAHWKVVARTYDGSVYTTPADQIIEYQVSDPRGAKLKEGSLTLNAFGSAWDALELTETLPLGAYQVSFWTPGRKQHIGGAALFRLEEYKLPEFRVRIKPPEEDGRRKTFRTGDRVEVDIQADYYFGGVVQDATIEVLLFQKPFQQIWRPTPMYPWYYHDILPVMPGGFGGPGQQIKREMLKTDAGGRATFTFDTPEGGTDTEYRIEARVTDTSRREVVAADTVRVTRQSHSVHLRPAHKLYQPQDKVSVAIHAMDANNQPVEARGLVHVTRDLWFEIWIDPTGREVQGEELQSLRQGGVIFPPPPAPGQRPWRLKFRGYQHDEILSRPMKTGGEGEAELTFTPDREGYYRIEWTGLEKEPFPISAESTVWVATGKTTELGYRHGGLEILVDKDTFHAGQTAPVMLSAPVSGGYVLFSVEADDLYSVRLVPLKGSVKLLEIPLTEKHVPNVYLGAAMVSGRQLYADQKQVVVPPVENFLTVEVTPDRKAYQPGNSGRLTVTTRDHRGRPVAAEVGLGVSDEAVYAIQKDLAPDPREFFFGAKRALRTQLRSSFQIKPYARMVETEEGRFINTLTPDTHPNEEILGGQYRQNGAGNRAGLAKMSARLPISQDSSVMFESGEMLANEAESFRGADSGGENAVQVRSDFRSTLLWRPDLVTGKDGRAEVEVNFADALTEWRATARVHSAGNQFGVATAHVRTAKPLIARLQAPRFFVVGDSVTVSAVLNNNTGKTLAVAAGLDAEGLKINGSVAGGRAAKPGPVRVEVPAHGETRVDWKMTVNRPGEAKLRLTARGKMHSDAMEKTYPVHEHGIEKFIAGSGKMTGKTESVTLTLPRERKPGNTEMTVLLTPSLGVTMLDALPYLIDYPYGCTEQTLSRFLPAVIVKKTLTDLGLNPQAVEQAIFGGIDEGFTGQTHPKGKKDFARLDSMVKTGLSRLYDFQHGDGGWGWWKGGESDHFMSAYVLWGLALARQSGIEVDAGVVKRAVRYLNEELVEEENALDRQAWMLHALAAEAQSEIRKPGKFQARALDNLWKRREQLNAYSRALVALAAYHFGDREKARTLVENLENGVIRDHEPGSSTVLGDGSPASSASLGTAHWGEDGLFRRWSDGGVEATAFALRALVAIEPGHALIEPVSHWLIKNRRGAHWKNTRDTAIVLLALNDYLHESGELGTRADFEILVNEKSIARIRVDDPLTGLKSFGVNPALLKDGPNTIRIVRKSGEGPLYYAAEARYFSLEEPIPAAGHEIFVHRQYYKLRGRPTLLKGYVYDKVLLADGDHLKSGERVEVVLTIEAKNHYEYLVFEDLKPAGFEAAALLSGEALHAKELKQAAAMERMGKRPPASAETRLRLPSVIPPDAGESDYTGRTRWVYQELRDRKVALFLDQLPEGLWEMRYELRAEVPGRFHALPVLGHAMYIPEIRANGSEMRLVVEDEEF